MATTNSYWEATKGLKYRDPMAAIVQAFADLKLAVALAAQTLEPAPTPDEAIDGLRAAGRVSEDVAAMYHDLQRVRNAVAHGEATPTVADAERFQDYADATVRALMRAAGG